MNEYITKMDHLRNVRSCKKQELEELNIKFSKVYDGCENLKQKIETRKANEEMLTAIAGEMSEKENDIKYLDNCIKLLQEMIAKEIANDIITALKENKKNLVNVPTHYKKFKTALEEVLNGRGGFLSHSYYTVYYHTGYNSPAGNKEIYICSTDAAGAAITEENVKNINLYELIPVNNIEQAVKDAMNANKRIKEIEEQAKKEIDEIRSKLNKSDVLINITR